MSSSTINEQQMTLSNLIDILNYARDMGENEVAVNILYSLAGMYEVLVDMGRYDDIINAIENSFQTNLTTLINVAEKHKNNKYSQKNTANDSIKFFKHSSDESDSDDFDNTRRMENCL